MKLLSRDWAKDYPQGHPIFDFVAYHLSNEDLFAANLCGGYAMHVESYHEIGHLAYIGPMVVISTNKEGKEEKKPYVPEMDGELRRTWLLGSELLPEGFVAINAYFLATLYECLKTQTGKEYDFSDREILNGFIKVCEVVS